MLARGIVWLSQSQFEGALGQSREQSIPLLLDFHHPTCEGCLRLEMETYSDPAVVKAIAQNVIPVRIITTEWDRLTTDIINCYISISTPTIQLVSSDGTVSHYWHSAPRQTVLSGRQISHSTRRVYIEANGNIPSKLFLSQLMVGLGKFALKLGRFEQAMQFFKKMRAEYSDVDPAIAEANYWGAIAAARMLASV